MNKPMNFVKGMGIGLAVGATAVCAASMLKKDNRCITKGSAKAMRAVGDFVDGIQTMFR